MSVDGRRPPSWRAAAAVLLLWAGPSLAAPVEVPRLDPPVGAGTSVSVVAPVGGVLAALVLAPSPLTLGAAPASAPVSVLAAPAASPAAGLAAPAAAAAAAPVAAAASPAAAFGRRAVPPSASAPAAADESTDDKWSRSAALFDLSAESAGDAAAVVPVGLPSNQAGKTLARLRKAGEDGRPGPGAIPGISRVEWAGRTGHGLSGETETVLIGGKPWFLKKLGASPDAVISETPRETRALNEAGFAAVLRGDPLLSRSFSVAPRVSVFRDGREVFVLSEGLPSVGDGESRRQELSALQRADASIVQLVLGLGDMHGANILPLGGGRFGLIDFEKLSRAPLEAASARRIDDEVLLKNFPLVDRLSYSDPALYRSRFEAWRAQYAAGGRERIDAALSASGWSPAQRQIYLAAVDRNLDTYLDRVQPYLDYGNGWFKRISDARAEAARAPPKEKKGFLGGLFGSGH